MKNFFRTLFCGAGLIASTTVLANISIPMYSTTTHKEIGVVEASDTNHGLKLIVKMRGLPKGIHGFHIHEKAACCDHGMCAGMHFDPDKTHKHLGPYKHGHLGDLPALKVTTTGKFTKVLYAPRLKLSMIENHSLMIHGGGDNYSDEPKKDGGGGERIACGEIK